MVGGRGIAANASSGIVVALLVPVVFVSALYVLSLCVGLLAVSYSIIAGSGLPDFHLPTLRDLSSGFTMMFWSAATPCAAACVAVSLSWFGSLTRRGLLGVLVVAALIGIAIDASANFGAIHTQYRLVGVGHIVVAPFVVLAVWLIHGLSGSFVFERGTRDLPNVVRQAVELLGQAVGLLQQHLHVWVSQVKVNPQIIAILALYVAVFVAVQVLRIGEIHIIASFGGPRTTLWREFRESLQFSPILLAHIAHSAFATTALIWSIRRSANSHLFLIAAVVACFLVEQLILAETGSVLLKNERLFALVALGGLVKWSVVAALISWLIANKLHLLSNGHGSYSDQGATIVSREIMKAAVVGLAVSFVLPLTISSLLSLVASVVASRAMLISWDHLFLGSAVAGLVVGCGVFLTARWTNSLTFKATSASALSCVILYASAMPPFVVLLILPTVVMFGAFHVFVFGVGLLILREAAVRLGIDP